MFGDAVRDITDPTPRPGVGRSEKGKIWGEKEVIPIKVAQLNSLILRKKSKYEKENIV